MAMTTRMTMATTRNLTSPTDPFPPGACQRVRTAASTTKETTTMSLVIAAVEGSLHIAVGASAAAIGVGLIGTKAVEAVGRNPGASGKILVQSILGMALAEAVAFYVIFLA